MSATLLSTRTVVEPDGDPDPSYLEQEGFEDRLAAYQAGEFGFVGVYVVAELNVAGTIQTIRTPGLWGIEDDSSDDYMADVARDELSYLPEILRQLGV